MPDKWLKIENKTEDSGDVYIYGVITDEKWYDSDVTPTWFKDQMAKLSKLKNINLFVNSPGGGVFAGMAIYHVINRVSAYVNGIVDGIAASISSVILMAADKITVPKTSLVMIHNPESIAIGDSAILRKEADVLDRVKATIVAAYAEKTKKKPEDIAALMDAETWMTGEEAVKNGFADTLDPAKNITACYQGKSVVINGMEVNLDNFKSFPKDRFSVAPEASGNKRLVNARNKFLQLKKESL
jgi:ATP-dependent Clp protease protease subunit